MKKALETALTADTPPSTKHLSRRLGYADDQLMQKRLLTRAVPGGEGPVLLGEHDFVNSIGLARC